MPQMRQWPGAKRRSKDGSHPVATALRAVEGLQTIDTDRPQGGGYKRSGWNLQSVATALWAVHVFKRADRPPTFARLRRGKQTGGYSRALNLLCDPSAIFPSVHEPHPPSRSCGVAGRAVATAGQRDYRKILT